MNPKSSAAFVTKCLTEDLSHCLGAEKLDQYSNGSITSPLELHAIESHLLVCQSCQGQLEASDHFICTLREAEPVLQFAATPSVSGQATIWPESYGLTGFVALLSLAATLLIVLAIQPPPDLKKVSLVSTRAASIDFQKPGQPLSFAIESRDSITQLPYSLRLLSGDGFVLKDTPQSHSAVLSLPRGLPPGQYWIQLIVSESKEPIREYSFLVKSESLQPKLADFVHRYFQLFFSL